MQRRTLPFPPNMQAHPPLLEIFCLLQDPFCRILPTSPVIEVTTCQNEAFLLGLFGGPDQSYCQRQ